MGGRRGIVLVQGEKAGLLEETYSGYRFTYYSSYVEKPTPLAVSLTMPVRKEPYFSRSLFPFFDGLIPEGWLLGVVERNWKIAATDRFGFLLASCNDPIGDVQVLREGKE